MKWTEILLSICFLVAGFYALKNRERLVETIEYRDRDDSLTKDNLMNEIKRAGIKFPDIVFKQAMIESGNLKCKNCSLDKNNLFGFRDSKGYIYFNTWIGSVYYYARWQNRKYKGGDYYIFLKEVGYAEDSLYIWKLKQ